MITLTHNKGNIEGQILRLERLRQGKGIKEVANDICSVSTLSKIERGKQAVDPDMLVALYKELGITYQTDKNFIKAMSDTIEQYFYEKIYQFEPKALNTLNEQNERLIHSPLGLKWMVIKGLEESQVSILGILDECAQFMDEESLAWYYLIPRYEDKKTALEKRIQAQKILQNSYATLCLMWGYWEIGQYNKVMNLSSKAVNYALDEGNTWILSQIYSMIGSIYACYNMEEQMIMEYNKAMNLLKNTNWQDSLEIMYYNIGATYISLENYKKAREYLGECKHEHFNLFHKLAVLEINTGNKERADHWICKMSEHIDNYLESKTTNDEWNEFNKSLYQGMVEILEVTKLQSKGNPEKHPEYILLLESLMDKFLSEGRYGFMLFHKNSLKEAYIENRRYKDALALEEILSSNRSKNGINILN